LNAPEPRAGRRDPLTFTSVKRPSRRTAIVIAAVMIGAFVVAGVLLTTSKLGKPEPVDPVEAGRSASDPEVDPFAWTSAREPELEAGAAAGFSHGLYDSYADGIVAAARQTASYSDRIRAAAEAEGVDPELMEAMVLLESGGNPNAIAGGTDVEGAVGLAQIVASTGADFLDMDIDVRKSQQLTDEIAATQHQAQKLEEKARDLGRRNPKQGRDVMALAAKKASEARRAEAERARVDPRFDPEQALAGMATYLRKASDELGREDLAVTSYHMGIGNLLSVIEAYGGSDAADSPSDYSYARLYFDTAPFDHAEAYDVLSRFEDDSGTYLWRVLAARDILRLYDEDRPELARQVKLQGEAETSEFTFYPPDTRMTFATVGDLRDAIDSGELVTISTGEGLGYEISPQLGKLAEQRTDISRAPYRSLTPAAEATLLYLAARVQEITGESGPKDNLILTAAARDEAYEKQLGLDPDGYTLHTTGNSFDIERTYASDEQALAFQFALDRLSALGVIDYTKIGNTIHVTVSPRAEALLGDVPD
jgi:soluble lytic murein transglycosylase-like protein